MRKISFPELSLRGGRGVGHEGADLECAGGGEEGGEALLVHGHLDDGENKC